MKMSIPPTSTSKAWERLPRAAARNKRILISSITDSRAIAKMMFGVFMFFCVGKRLRNNTESKNPKWLGFYLVPVW